MIKQRVDLVWSAYICSERIPVKLCSDFLCVVGMAGVDDHLGALPGKGASDAQADVVRGTCDQGDLFIK